LASSAQLSKPDHRFRRLFDTLGRNELLTPHLEAFLLSHGSRAWPDRFAIEVINKEREWDGYFHPSSHAAMPELQLFYEFHPEFQQKLRPEKPTVGTELAWKIGAAIHAVEQSLLIHGGFAEAGEVEKSFLNKKRWSSGHLDVRELIIPNLDVRPPLEIKTIGYIPREPLPEHVLQLQIYMDLGCKKPQKLGILLYIGKKFPHEYREFVLRRDDELLLSIYEKWARVREAVRMDDPGKLVNCCEPGSSMHHLCPARFVCRIGPPPSRIPSSRR
jgi:hypothetical protein